MFIFSLVRNLSIKHCVEFVNQNFLYHKKGEETVSEMNNAYGIQNCSFYNKCLGFPHVDCKQRNAKYMLVIFVLKMT